MFPAELPAHGQWTPPEPHCNRTDAAPGMQQVRDRNPFRLREKSGGDHGRPLMGNGSVLLDVSGLQNDRVAVPPSVAGTTADTHDPARFGIAHSLFHQLIIVRPCSVLQRGAPGLPRPFRIYQFQLPITQVLQRLPDAKPTKRLNFRPALSGAHSGIEQLSVGKLTSADMCPGECRNGPQGDSGVDQRVAQV